MSQRTRYFLVGSVVVISACLCTGLVAYYNGSLPLRLANSAGPAELAYLPADTTAVAYANVNEIMNSEFRQKIRQVLPTGEEKDKLLAEIGLDIEHDIDSVVAGVSGQPSLTGGLVLVRGRINTVQIEALAVQHGATTEDYKGKHMVLAGDAHKVPTVNGAQEQFTGAVAFLETGLIALGDASAIRRGIDASLSHEDATKNAELMKCVVDAERGSNAWAVGRFDQAAISTTLPREIQDLKDRLAVKWVSVSAHINGGVNGTVRAEARDQEAADQLRSIANGALAAGQLVAGHDSKIDAMLKSLQVSGTGTTVAISFAVPPELLDMINGAAGLSNLIGKDKSHDHDQEKAPEPRQIKK